MKIYLWIIYLTILAQPLFAEESKTISVRMAAYNVEFSKSCTAEEVGDMFKPYDLDIIGFNEAPDGDWTKRVGVVLGMPYYYVGKISSANHKDKYKTILSRTPLINMHEFELKGEHKWNPASAVRAETIINGKKIAFYSVHICRSYDKTGHAYQLVSEVLSKEKNESVFVVGDFNNNIGDPSLDFIEEIGYKPIWKNLDERFSNTFTFIHDGKPPRKNNKDRIIKEAPIDHIFYNSAAGGKVTEGGIIEMEKPLSDHKPIWARIDFPLF